MEPSKQCWISWMHQFQLIFSNVSIVGNIQFCEQQRHCSFRMYNILHKKEIEKNGKPLHFSIPSNRWINCRNSSKSKDSPPNPALFKNEMNFFFFCFLSNRSTSTAKSTICWEDKASFANNRKAAANSVRSTRPFWFKSAWKEKEKKRENDEKKQKIIMNRVDIKNNLI